MDSCFPNPPRWTKRSSKWLPTHARSVTWSDVNQGQPNIALDKGARNTRTSVINVAVVTARPGISLAGV